MFREFQVEADVHHSQSSYIIPRRFPKRPVNYASAATPQGRAGPVSDLSAATPSTASAAPRSTVSSAASVHQPSAAAPPDVAVIMENCQQLISTTVSSLFAKLSSLLFELFSLNLLEEGKRERQGLLINMIRNHFGADISSPLLEQYRDSTPPTPQASVPPPKVNKVNKASAGVQSGKKLASSCEPSGSRPKNPASNTATRASTRKK